jgi:hypothetical protein
MIDHHTWSFLRIEIKQPNKNPFLSSFLPPSHPLLLSFRKAPEEISSSI